MGGSGFGRTSAPPCSYDSIAAKMYSSVASASRPEERRCSCHTPFVTSSRNAWMRFGKVAPKSLMPVFRTCGCASCPMPRLSPVPGPGQYVSFSIQFSMQNVPLLPATSTLHQPPRPHTASPRWLSR